MTLLLKFMVILWVCKRLRWEILSMLCALRCELLHEVCQATLLLHQLLVSRRLYCFGSIMQVRFFLRVFEAGLVSVKKNL